VGVYNKCIGDDTIKRRSQNPKCIRKTRNTFSGTRVFVHLPKFWRKKKFSHAKFHWNQAIGCWVMARNDFQHGGRPPFWIFKNSFLVMWLSSSCVAMLIKIGWFLLRYGDGPILKMAPVRHLEFVKSGLYERLYLTQVVRGVRRNWWRGCFYFPFPLLFPSIPSPSVVLPFSSLSLHLEVGPP